MGGRHEKLKEFVINRVKYLQQKIGLDRILTINIYYIDLLIGIILLGQIATYAVSILLLFLNLRCQKSSSC